MSAIGDCGLIVEQTYVLAAKHFAQKRRGGRTTLKVSCNVCLLILYIYMTLSHLSISMSLYLYLCFSDL